jgi:hypothetical protein
VTNNIWIAYAIEINSVLFLTNNLVTVLSSAFIGFYKFRELYNERQKRIEMAEIELEMEKHGLVTVDI